MVNLSSPFLYFAGETRNS